MLAVYLTALVAGGFFVGLSALGGGDTEADTGFDELGTDIELDGDADLDVDARRLDSGGKSRGKKGY